MPSLNPGAEPAESFRRMSLVLRALWGRDVQFRDLRPAPAERGAQRPRIEGDTVRVPRFPAAAQTADHAVAIAVHAGAHLMYSRVRFPVAGLTLLQIAAVSVHEDARVERLAKREYPGLGRFWPATGNARPDAATSAGAWLSRLARALVQDAVADDDRLIADAWRAFLARRDTWDDPSVAYELGSRFGAELERLGMPFHPAQYVFGPAYRDDNACIWDGGETGEPRRTRDASREDTRHTRGDTHGQRERIAGRRTHAASDIAARRRAPGGERGSPGQALSPPEQYDEWDYLSASDRPAWCTLRERSPDEGDAGRIDAVLDRNRDLVNRVKRLVRALQVRRPARLRRRLDGDRLDLDACIDAIVDTRAGLPPDPRVHASLGRRQRDLSVLVLLDLSQSTNDFVPSAGTTVIELAREATAVLADAMERIGDRFAIHGFASNGRHDVGYFRFKDFDAPFGVLARSRLAGMSSGLSTRMGTALRHAGRQLDARRAHRKLILLITDGEPSDIDVNDPRYLMLDAKKVVEDNARRGIYTYCLSLDPKADRYVSRIFGPRNWTVVDHLRRLPEKLPLLYMRLTH